MPTYEYECKRCQRIFEIFQSITDKHLQKCPRCKGKIKRLIGRGAGFIFKGTGFYQTDYRSEHYKKRAAEEKKSVEPVAGADTKKSAAKKEKSAPADKHAG